MAENQEVWDPSVGTPVTMERAVSFGFQAGLGFILAQLLVGGIIWAFWAFVMTKHF